jgi:beta-glucanase (GH16 family)
MSFWDGTRWVPDRPTTVRAPRRRRARDWFATGVMLVGLLVLVFPGEPSEATGPQLTAAPAAARPGDALRITGSGFTTHATVQLAWDGSTRQMPSVKVGGGGTFKARVVVGNAAPGGHVITAFAAPAGVATAARSVGSTVLAEPVASVSVTVLASTDPATPIPSAAPTAIPTPVPTPTAVVTPVPATPAPTAAPTAPPTPQPTTAPTPPPAQQFTFADEFNGTALASHWRTSCATSLWGPETAGWLPEQNSVSGGYLHIKAERIAANLWKTGLVDTWSSFSQRYGWFEARIRIPKGAGLWPAFWTLQRNPGGGCGNGPGELDIMEILANPIGARNGEDASLLFQVVHDSAGGQQMNWTRSSDLSAGFHVYGMEWRAGYIDFYLDGVRTHRYTGPMPSGSMYVLLNLAVGGWPGPSDSSTGSPSEMLVDWVRVRP